jgi:hypothetical protein
MYTLGSAGTPTNSIVFAGRLDDVNALLDGLIFSPPKDYNSVTSGETVVITFSVNDQGNTGASATPLTAEKYLQVFVSAVNDEPIIVDDYLSYPVNINEGTPTSIGNKLEVLDVDEDYLLTLTVECTNLGTLSLSKATSAYVVHASVVSSTAIVVEGTLSNVNEVLNDIVYTSQRGANAKGQKDTLTVTVEDGPTATVTKTLQLNFVNEPTPPDLTAPKSLSVDETAEEVIPGVLINDVDLSPTDAIEVSVSATYGSVKLSPPSSAHVIFNVGSPSTLSSTLSVKASVSDMALILPTLSYSTPSNYSPSLYAQDTVTITAIDSFSSPTQQTTVTTFVTVAGASSPPTINVPSTPFTTSEDSVLSFPSDSISFNSISNHNELHKVTIQSTFGKLKLGSTVGINTLSGPNVYKSKVEFSGSIDNCNNAVSGMKYSPASKFVGLDKVRKAMSRKKQTMHKYLLTHPFPPPHFSRRIIAG